MPSSSATGRSGPVLRTLAWSIAVVLVGGVAAALTTPVMSDQTVVQQGLGPPVPADHIDPAAAGVPAAVTATTATSAPAATAAPTTAAPTTTTTKAKERATAAKPAAAAKAAPAGPAAPAAPRLQPDAGSYPLRISGTSSVGGKAASVPSTGSLVISQQGGDQQHRMVGMPGDVVLLQRATASGVDLVSFSLAAGSKTLTFRPPSPVPFVRTDPGASWSWSARSTDGTVNVNQTATVTGGGSVNVGGTAVPAVTVQRVFNVSGAVTGTVRLTSSVSQADRLPLMQQQVIDVSATVLLLSTRMVSDTTATLTSTSAR